MKKASAQTRTLPRHVAIIMDGNGRWAKNRGQVRWDGHSAGAKSVRVTVEAAAKMGIEYLTLYAFSVNNWNRPRLEVEALMRLLTHFAKKEQAELIRQNIRVEVVGHFEELPARPRQAVKHLMDATSHCTGMTLSLALSYGARRDVIEAVRRLAVSYQEGRISLSDIDDDALRVSMSTSRLPDVDLLIRTGGQSRVSDFLLLECAYAELCFLDVMWPDFREEHLQQAVEHFQGVERRFGLTGAQVAQGMLAGAS
jgi:undecaprenyl diphosphate synthase